MKFLNKLIKIVNNGQSRSVVVTGNIYDLFFDGKSYVPLIDLLSNKCKVDPKPNQKGITQLVYETNRCIEVRNPSDLPELENIWRMWRKDEKTLTERLSETNDYSAYSFELLRQLTETMRKSKAFNNLLILIEGADLLLPEANEISKMNGADRRRVAIVQDWLSDPDFMSGHDTVILLAESRSLLHHRIARLPQIVTVEVPLPNLEERKHFIDFFSKEQAIEVNSTVVAEQTSGLSLHAIRQLLCSRDVSSEAITRKVEEYIVGQLGEGVVEFKRPQHTLKDVIGYTNLKYWFQIEFIPRIKSTGDDAISGAAVAGPIGGGKTFILEALVSEINAPVMVLKNIRSKWYGDTDQIFERLRRIVEQFYKLVIFIDEADTVFGGIDSDHETERRLTGKIQSMMSDPILKGHVFWLLITARIHRLSPDIRRPGRMDLIIPILDPESKVDIDAFIKWTFGSLVNENTIYQFANLCKGFSAAMFAAVKSELKAKNPTTINQVLDILTDIVQPDIGDTRQYQILQAKINCTRLSLLYPRQDFIQTELLSKYKSDMKDWKSTIQALEAKGIH